MKNVLYDTDLIKNSVSMRELLGRFGVEFDRSGYACCPFHTEKTGSFKVKPDDKTAHCFGCGVTVDVIDFVKKLHSCTFTEACRCLDEMYNLGMTPDHALTYREKQAIIARSRQQQEEARQRAERKEAAFKRKWEAFDRLKKDEDDMRNFEPQSPEWLRATRDIEQARYLLEQAETEVMKLNE